MALSQISDFSFSFERCCSFFLFFKKYGQIWNVINTQWKNTEEEVEGGEREGKEEGKGEAAEEEEEEEEENVVGKRGEGERETEAGGAGGGGGERRRRKGRRGRQLYLRH